MCWERNSLGKQLFDHAGRGFCTNAVESVCQLYDSPGRKVGFANRCPTPKSLKGCKTLYFHEFREFRENPDYKASYFH